MDKELQFGCDRCFRQDDAATTSKATAGSDRVADLVEESHFSVRVVACPACGQRFVSIFCETIDWMDGDDPQYWILLPLRHDESEKLISTGGDLDLIRRWGSDRRHLHMDHPKGKPMHVYWSDGPLFIPLHD